MITPQTNPMLYDDNTGTNVPFAITKDSTLDADTYSRFIYACERLFRRSRFYKDYKSMLYDIGLDRDQFMPAINTEVADIEMHHHFPQLKQASIMIAEHLLNTKGCCTSFEVISRLEEAHRKNQFAIIFLSTTNHQNYHTYESSTFISLSQCYGNPFEFLREYGDGLTLDISFKFLAQLKMEQQYNSESFTPTMAFARDALLSFQKNYNEY